MFLAFCHNVGLSFIGQRELKASQVSLRMLIDCISLLICQLLVISKTEKSGVKEAERDMSSLQTSLRRELSSVSRENYMTFYIVENKSDHVIKIDQ